MYLVLLIFGVLSIAAGLVLAVSGVSIHDRLFDPTLIAPGMVAAVGGLLLIGLGSAVRVLQRIEQALTTRPMMPRPARLGEPAAAVAPTSIGVEPTSEPPPRIPFPHKPESRPPPAPVAAPATPPAEDTVIQQLREKLAPLSRLDRAADADSDEPLLPQQPTGTDEDIGDVDYRHAANGRNGAAAPTIARFDRPPPAAPRPSRVQKFDTLWPKRQRPTRQAQPAPAAPEFAPEPSVEPAVEELTALHEEETPAPLSILKSGVVDGMAYTLYSDGSIEAQLPQGTLRFGSITELRNHIEQNN
jgi:hypothetical protein